MRQDPHPIVLALKSSVRPDVILVAVGVHDAQEGGVLQGTCQLPGAVSASAIDQCAINEIGGGPVAAAAGQRASQIEPGDPSELGNPQHAPVPWMTMA